MIPVRFRIGTRTLMVREMPVQSPARVSAAAACVVVLSVAPLLTAALVSGRVVDGSGVPLGDVAVQLAVKGLSATTGADGTFELRDDATVLPNSSVRFGVSTVDLRGGVLSVVASPRGARASARLYDARGRVVSVLFEGVLRPGATLRAPVFGKAAGLAHGVYLLEVGIDGMVGRYEILHAGRSAEQSLSLTSPASLAKALAAVDTLRLSRGSCTAKTIVIEQYGVDLGDITLPCAGDGIRIPSLTSFLPNDGALPAGPLVYVFDSNVANGSGSDAANAKEIQAAINAATPGQTLVAVAAEPGGTSFYDRPDGLTWTSATSGSSDSRIALIARPGDAVVIDRGRAFAAFRTPSPGQSTVWTQSGLSSDHISKKMWRSVQNFGGSTARPLSGKWNEFDAPHFIPPYQNLTDLSAPVGVNDMPTNYAGPGAVLHSDGYVYIRMQKPYPGKYSAGDKWPSDGRLFDAPGKEVGGGKLDFPITEDPRDYAIYLAVSGGTAFSLAGKKYWTIGDGINSNCYQTTIYPGGAANIGLGRGLHYCNRWFMQQGGGSWGDFTCNRTRISVGSQRHLSFVEFKFGARYFENTGRGSLWETATGALASNLHFVDCTIHGFFDLAVGGSPGGHKFIHCDIWDVMDDGIQHDPGTLSNVEYGWCYLLSAGFDGPEYGGGLVCPGAWYVHHNIMDYRALRVADVGGREPYPMSLVQYHSANASRPGKYFNNTAVVMTDAMDQQRIPFDMFSRRNASPVAHECFNNILLVCNGAVGASTRYNSTSPYAGPSDQVIKGLYDDDNSKYDYNLYWRDPALAPFVKGIIEINGIGQGYNTLAAATSAHPGIEPHGVEAKPAIPTIDNYPDGRYKYRPTADANVTSAYTGQANSPAGESMAAWPAQPSPWKGALDPNGTDMTVGVRNP